MNPNNVLRPLEDAVSDQSETFTVCKSEAMSNIFDTVKRVGPTSLPVLITGDSGTGKEVVAQAIHASSTRSVRKLVVVDCAAIPPNLMESELFGHRKGAFTGASSTHKGLVQSADGTTFFLDEIGELPSSVQTKLLRLLQDGSFRPVGETTRRHADLRIIAATNRNIEEEVAAGRFRRDLYHRLNTVHIHIPPLRNRPSDILPLYRKYIDHFCRMEDRPPLELSNEVSQVLVEAKWSGNVREVVNCAQYVASLTEGPTVEVHDLPAVLQARGGKEDTTPYANANANQPSIRTDLPYMEAKRKWLNIFEDGYVSAILESNGGNVSAAAREAHMDRKSIQRILKRITERTLGDELPAATSTLTRSDREEVE
jgi:DNA-binding NtrC family response regulator